MKAPVEMELRHLINDMREYLESLGNEVLSPNAEASRLRLLARLSVSYSPPPAYYIDMSKSNSLQNSSDKGWSEGSYEVMCGSGPPPIYTNTMPDVLSSSKRLSAISQVAERTTVPVRSGALTRRKRRKPGFLPNRTTNYWAALTSTTLHLYQTDKETKPALQIDLMGYQARHLVPNPKNEFAFEIFSPGKKTYQFVAPSQEELEGWIASVCEGCTESSRELPEPPTCQDHYDVPDSRVRPVLYHHHSHYQSVAPSPTQEHVYKNVDDFNSDNTYYNIVGSPREFKTEQIYQTIGENKMDEEVIKEMQPKDESIKKPGQRNSGGRVQQIVKAMEGQDGRELYEPVDGDRLAR